MLLTVTFTEYLLGISASFIASFIFIVFLLLFLRPRVIISTEICKRLDDFDETKRLCYMIKVLNRSWFSAYDITGELSSVVSYPVKDGINHRFTPLKMKTEKLTCIAPYRPAMIKPKYGNHAMLFTTYEDIEGILKEVSRSIQFQITLRHGLTGLSKVYIMDYAQESSIKGGHFIFGNNFAIL